jgi:hypothetical protein
MKSKDGFNQEVEAEGFYYCASCGNITRHDKKGFCENTQGYLK